MKTYNVVYNKDKNKGVFGISLVENPAMEGNFIALSKQDNQIKLAKVDEEKRELIGLVLEPDKPIYRNQGGQEFNILFTKDTVKDLLLGFSKNGYQNNSTLEHEDALKLEGVTFFENWIVEDEANDKSNIYGLNAKKGSWIAKLKVDDDLVWNNFVKTGFVKGFSVDAMVNLEEIKLNSDMSKVDLNESFFEKLSVTLSNIFKPKEEVKAELQEEVKEVVEEVKEEVKAEAVEPKEEIKEEVKEELSADDLMNSLTKALTSFKDEITAELKAVKEENVKLNEQVVELGKKPVRKPMRAEVEQREMTPYEQYKASKEEES